MDYHYYSHKETTKTSNIVSETFFIFAFITIFIDILTEHEFIKDLQTPILGVPYVLIGLFVCFTIRSLAVTYLRDTPVDNNRRRGLDPDGNPLKDNA